MDTMKPTPTPDESKALNDCIGPCLILAGAGMCNAGRILHHLKQNLWKPETSVVIPGFQGVGTLGRALVDGAKEVKIFGERIAVKAHIHTLGGFSAHAGQSDLVQWLGQVSHSKPRVALTHGEAKGREPLARIIQEKFQLTALLPNFRETVEL
jgi:metallo-beta-lactamase family protein